MSLSSKKKLQKTHLRLKLLLLKCLLVTHNFLDWYGILTTQSRLVCATFQKKFIGNRHYMKKKQVAKVHSDPKCQDLNFEFFKNIQNNLHWHENFSSITRLQRNITSTHYIENEHWMKETQAPQVATINMQFCKLKLNLWTLNGFQKISRSWTNLKILLHELEEIAQIPQQVLLNSNMGCKSYNTSNWISRLYEDTLAL